MNKLFAIAGTCVILAGIISSCSLLQGNQVNANQVPVAHTPTIQRPDFATGIAFPQWGTSAYSKPDWQKGLQEIQQLHAKWIGITLPLHMTGPTSMQVQTRADTPTPQDFQKGIKQARQLGFRVYVTPLITLDGINTWAGYISFDSDWQTQSWFSSYWQVLQPYINILNQEHVEMFSVGNEYDRLEDESPLSWLQFIQKVRINFSGKIIYSMNWASFAKPLPSWLDSLDTIGCSTYFSVTTTQQRLSDQQAIDLWKTNVQSQLDHITLQTGKPIFITEIGYRSGSTAGYMPYVGDRQEPQDDQEQAILYNAAMQDMSTDQNISGVFWWAWSTPPFAPNGKPAAKVLGHWFS